MFLHCHTCAVRADSWHTCAVRAESRHTCAVRTDGHRWWLKMHQRELRASESWGWGLAASEGCTGITIIWTISRLVFVKRWPGIDAGLHLIPIRWTLISALVCERVILL